MRQSAGGERASVAPFCADRTPSDVMPGEGRASTCAPLQSWRGSAFADHDGIQLPVSSNLRTSSLFLSVIMLGGIMKGIELLARTDIPASAALRR
jgi:hypothetical protein